MLDEDSCTMSRVLSLQENRLVFFLIDSSERLLEIDVLGVGRLWKVRAHEEVEEEHKQRLWIESGVQIKDQFLPFC